MSRSFVISSIVTGLVLVACGGSSVVVGTTDSRDQKLQTRKDGGATGNGNTCSWENTSTYDQFGKSAAIPTYALNDEFQSIDGCNDCKCTTQGIMCTVRTCEPQACDADAQMCPDGSAVGRTGPKCTFAPCPGQTVCTDDAKKCADGSFVGRTGPNCEFVCPNDPPVACPAIAMQCPDGSYAKTGPNCEFICPPEACEKTEDAAFTKIRSTIDAYQKCLIDSDCVIVAVASQCLDRCSAPMAKVGLPDYEAAVQAVNENLCKDYAAQGCKVEHPACAPSQPPKCVDMKCQ